jgi:hypothetical protein
MLPSIYFSGFFEDLTVPCINLKNLVKMSKFEGTVHKDINMMRNKYDITYFVKMCKLVAAANQ